MEKAVAKRPIDTLKLMLSERSIQEQFQNALKENSGPFIASIIDIYAGDTYLQKCEPRLVVMECLKAATLKLPINKSLGFVYIVPYKDKPQMQIGYKGFIQLAMRTGQYRIINAGAVLDGITVERDLLTGSIHFTGSPASDKVQGYFAYFELLNGFSKAMYMTTEEVIAHAKRYSKSFNSEQGAWKLNFEAMAIKTPLRLLLGRYGIMSTEMQKVIEAEVEDEVQHDVTEHANQDVIDVDPETGEIVEPTSQLETDEQANTKATKQLEKASGKEQPKCAGCGTTKNVAPNENGDYFCEACMTGKGKPTTQAPF